MKVLWSDALRNPGDWHAVDARDFASLPNRGIPDLGARGDRDNEPGYVSEVMVQGLMFSGQDHVAVAPHVIGNDDGVRVWCWNDDPFDVNQQGGRVAHIWTIMPLAPDPYLGMAINTRQSQVCYAEGDGYDRLLANHPGFTVRPWAEFESSILQTIDPAITRHGIWVPDEHWERQVNARTPVGYHHWCEHLPESEWEWERNEVRHNRRMVELREPRRVLKCQRDQGRYRQAEHTITYYQRTTDRAVGWNTFTQENGLESTAGGSETELVTANSSTVAAWCFTTPANQPNQGTWTTGVYHVQLDCSASGGGSYGVNGNTADDCTLIRGSSDLATIVQNQTAGGGPFSGTGLKLHTSSSIAFAGTDASDVFAFGVVIIGTSHGHSVTLRFSADAYTDGPWTTDPPRPIRPIVISQAPHRAASR